MDNLTLKKTSLVSGMFVSLFLFGSSAAMANVNEPMQHPVKRHVVHHHHVHHHHHKHHMGGRHFVRHRHGFCHRHFHGPRHYRRACGFSYAPAPAWGCDSWGGGYYKAVGYGLPYCMDRCWRTNFGNIECGCFMQ